MRDNQPLKGYVTITLKDARTGKVKVKEVRNLIVTTGEQWVADRMLPTSLQGGLTGGKDMSWVELGLSSLAAAAGHTDLQDTFGPSSQVRKKYTTNTRSGATWTIIVNWGTSDANTAGISEAGIFNSSVQGDGIMLARTTFTPVNKTSGDTLKIQWDINVSDDGV